MSYPTKKMMDTWYEFRKHSCECGGDCCSVNEDIKRIAALNKDLIIKRLSEFKKDNFDHEIAIKTGDAADNILDLSSSESADLIVMGSNGKDDISDFFMGTTSSKVLEKSTIPVLVVPNTD